MKVLLLLLLLMFLSQNSYGQEQETSIENEKSVERLMEIHRANPTSTKAWERLQGIYEFDELSPDFYNKDYYTVLRDSTPLKVVEKYLRKDNVYLNYIRVRIFDTRGNILEKKNLDTLYAYKKGVVCSAPLIRQQYDERNNVIEIANWRNDTTKIVNDCDFWHKVKSEYDSKNRVKVHASYSISGKLLTKVKFEYNSKNQKRKVMYLDENDNLDGDNSIVLVKYDKQNRVIKKTYRNADNKSSKDPSQWSISMIEYGEGFRIVTDLNYKKEVLKKVKITGNRVVSMSEDVKDD